MVNSSAISHGFLRVTVNIERLEQNLTTDLLNHIIFLQKGFAKVYILILFLIVVFFAVVVVVAVVLMLVLLIFLLS